MTPRQWAAREARQLRKMRLAFVECARHLALFVPQALRDRERRIAALPLVWFKGRPLRAVRCCWCGRQRNLPESVLWALCDPRRVVCRWCLHKGPPKARDLKGGPQ